MRYSKDSFESICIYGISKELTNSQRKNFTIIRSHWKFFNSLLRRYKIQLGPDWKKYGVTYYRSNTYFYLTGVCEKIDDLDIEEFQIPTGNYAVFEHKGPLEKLRESIYTIHKNIIPTERMVRREDQELIQYELYDSRFFWNHSDSVIEIRVPIH